MIWHSAPHTPPCYTCSYPHNLYPANQNQMWSVLGPPPPQPPTTPWSRSPTWQGLVPAWIIWVGSPVQRGQLNWSRSTFAWAIAKEKMLTGERKQSWVQAGLATCSYVDSLGLVCVWLQGHKWGQSHCLSDRSSKGTVDCLKAMGNALLAPSLLLPSLSLYILSLFPS